MRRQRGSIIRRGPDSYAIKYRTTPDGKQKWEGGFTTKDEAAGRLDDVLRELRTGEYVEPRIVTFADFAEEWIASRKSIRGSTLSAYRSLIRCHLIPHFGPMRMGEVRPEAIEGLVNKLVGKVAPKTLHNCVTLLRVMIAGKKGRNAIKRGYTRYDATLGVEMPSRGTRLIVPPTKQEVWKLIDAAKEIGGPGYAAVFLDAFTGLRRGEVLALRFSDVDWLNKEVCVQRSISKAVAEDGVHKWLWKIGPTKNGKARRVAAADAVIQLLAAQKRGQPEDAFIFSGPAGQFIDPDYFDSSIFAPVAQAAKLTVRFHDLRHFFASMLIDQGESPKYVCDQMGHSSIQVTFDTYGHLFPQARQEAARRLQKSMFAGRRKTGIGSTIGSKTHQKPQQSRSEERPN